MKTLRTIALIIGIILLAAGVFVQDFRTTTDTIVAFNVTSTTSGAPSWSDMISVVSGLLPSHIRIGMVLKLMALALLFFLFFTEMRQSSRKLNTTLPTLFGLGSAISLAIYAASASIANSLQWVIHIFISRSPHNIEEFTDTLFVRGNVAILGSVALSLGLFLFGAALFAYRRKTGKRLYTPLVVTSVSLLLCQVEARPKQVYSVAGPFWLDVILAGGFFTAIAAVCVIAGGIATVLALLWRRRKPQWASLLPVVLCIIVSLLVIVYWINTSNNIEGITTLIKSRDYSPADLSSYVSSSVVSGFLLSIVLILVSVFLPILCAFSLRVPRELRETEKRKKSPLPLLATIITVIILVAAGCIGLYENPYKASLRRVSLAMYSYEKQLPDDVARLESEEGLQFLRRTLNDPNEFYWHKIIIEYLWHQSTRKELVLNMLADDSPPFPAAYAYETVKSHTIYPGGYDYDAVIYFLKQRPELGSKFIQMAIETRNSSKLIYDIMEICAEKSVRRFPFRAATIFNIAFHIQIHLSVGVTLHYPEQPPVGTTPISLLWYDEDKDKPITSLFDGRLLLKSNGNLIDCVTVESGEITTNYNKFVQYLKQEKNSVVKEPSIILFIEHNVPACYFGYVLEACGRAGFADVSILKP